MHAVPGGEDYFTTKISLCQHIFSNFVETLCCRYFIVRAGRGVRQIKYFSYAFICFLPVADLCLIKAFYEQNSKRFTLRKPIVKGLLLKVPKNAPSLSSLRSWVASGSQSAVEKIEKYAIKNAIGYDYFYDHWVWFDDVKDNIPYDFGNDDSFLRLHKDLEVSQNDNVYLLHISEYKTAGSVMPYEFARQRIIEILANRSRVEFNEELKRDVYNRAVSEGRVEYFYGDITAIMGNKKK